VERRVFCASGPSDVYRAVSTSLGRERFWATSAPESAGVISFVLADGRAGDCRIEQAVQDELYRLQYFGRTLTFTLVPGDTGGTDLTLGADAPDDAEVVSLLLRLKASVDFGVDLRNHDAARSTSYADS
jgi:hypothetical protein